MVSCGSTAHAPVKFRRVVALAPRAAAVVPPAHSEEFAHVRQKYDQGCYGGCNTTLDERRPRARKRWHRKYVHRHRGANWARRTRNKTERLDAAARRSNES